MKKHRDPSGSSEGERIQPSPEIWYEGGQGDSVDRAIIVRGARHDFLGTWAEFAWLSRQFGGKDKEWRLLSHSHGTYGEREIDTVRIALADGSEKTLYFDITESFGLWPPDFGAA